MPLVWNLGGGGNSATLIKGYSLAELYNLSDYSSYISPSGAISGNPRYSYYSFWGVESRYDSNIIRIDNDNFLDYDELLIEVHIQTMINNYYYSQVVEYLSYPISLFKEKEWVVDSKLPIVPYYKQCAAGTVQFICGLKSETELAFGQVKYQKSDTVSTNIYPRIGAIYGIKN